MPVHQEKINGTFVVAHPTGTIDVDTGREAVVIFLPHLEESSGPQTLLVRKTSSDKNKITFVGDKCKINDDDDIVTYGLPEGGVVNLKYNGQKWKTLTAGEGSNGVV